MEAEQWGSTFRHSGSEVVASRTVYGRNDHIRRMDITPREYGGSLTRAADPLYWAKSMITVKVNVAIWSRLKVCNVTITLFLNPIPHENPAINHRLNV
jgi:hypothetical protein